MTSANFLRCNVNGNTNDDDRLYIWDLQSGLDDIGTDDEDGNGNSQLPPQQTTMNSLCCQPVPVAVICLVLNFKPARKHHSRLSRCKVGHGQFFMGGDFDDEDKYAAEEDADGILNVVQQLNGKPRAAFTEENRIGGNNNITGAPEGKNNLHLGLVRKIDSNTTGAWG